MFEVAQNPASTAVLTVHGLSKTYAGRPAVAGLALEVGRGQVFGLLGPNGSGKTTTLGMILGAIRPDRQGGAGRQISWFGTGASAHERRRIGALLEQPTFYPWLTGEANLHIFAAIRRLPRSAVAVPLRRVGLFEQRQQVVSGYSLGMRQRLAIALTLLGTPEVLVLDEPTNGVDAQGIADIRALIAAFAAEGGTVILASHMLDEVEKVCSHLAIMKQGRVLRAGSVREVLSTAGWTELAAADRDALARAVRDLEPTARVEWTAGANPCLQLHGGRLAPADLNQRLAAQGIYLSHLHHKQPSLESQYLRLVAGEDNP